MLLGTIFPLDKHVLEYWLKIWTIACPVTNEFYSIFVFSLRLVIGPHKLIKSAADLRAFRCIDTTRHDYGLIPYKNNLHGSRDGNTIGKSNFWQCTRTEINPRRHGASPLTLYRGVSHVQRVQTRHNNYYGRRAQIKNLRKQYGVTVLRALFFVGTFGDRGNRYEPCRRDRLPAITISPADPANPAGRSIVTITRHNDIGSSLTRSLGRRQWRM